MGRESYLKGADPAWTGLLTWGTLGVIVCSVGFWLTIVKPEDIRMSAAEANVSGLMPGDLALCTQQVLIDVDDMEPMKLLRDGQTEDAVGEARHLIDKDPWNVRNLMCAGDVFVAAPADKPLNEEGYRLLLRSIYMCPQSKYVRLNYARALVKGKRIEEATKQYDKVVRTNLDVLPSLELARLYVTNGDEEKAIRLLTQVIQKDGENASARKLLGIALARNHDEKAGYEEYLKAFGQEASVGRPEDAKAVFEKNKGSLNAAIKEQQEMVVLKRDEIQPKLILAQMLIMQGKFDEAKTLLNTAKEKDKNNPEIHRILTELYHQMSKEDIAYQEWLTANKLDKEI